MIYLIQISTHCLNLSLKKLSLAKIILTFFALLFVQTVAHAQTALEQQCFNVGRECNNLVITTLNTSGSATEHLLRSQIRV